MKKLLIIVFIISIGQSSFAESLISIEDVKRLNAQVMEKIASGDLIGGGKQLRPYYKFPEKLDSFLLAIDIKFSEITEKLGQPIGWDLITEKKIGQSYLQLIYLQKFNSQALVLRFLYYKPFKKWYFDSFTYKNDITSLLD